MPATMTTISNVLKEIYEGPLRLQLNDDVKTLRRIERTSKGVGQDASGGKYVTFPIHTRRNQGIGARNEGEALPVAGQQGTLSARVGLKYLYGTLKLNGQLFELAKSDKQSFISAVTLEMDGLKRDLAVDMNRQVYGTNLGAVATITAAVTSTTFTISHSTWLQLDMVVDICDSAGAVKAAGRTVTAITATSVTVSGAAQAVVVGDIITRTGSSTKELTGLAQIVQASGALFNVTDAVWTANVDANGGTARPLSEGLMINMADTIRTRGGSVSVIFGNLGVRRAYFNLLSQQRRITNTQKFTGGFEGLAFTTDDGDIPMVSDVSAPPRTMYFLNEKNLKVYREMDFSFMDRDGSMFSRVSGFDAYEATMYSYCELGVDRRNTHGVIQDITEG